MNPKIESVRQQIETLEDELRGLMHSCNHDTATIHKGRTSPGPYDKVEDYIYINCPECGISYTYYEDDREYDNLKNR